MKLFVGLGNPGEKYERTRHNIGFMTVDAIVSFLGNSAEWKTKFESDYIKTRYQNENVLIVKPQTFMNNSGSSVRKWTDYYDIQPEDVYIFYDEMDIPFNKMKLKTGGSSGGHNGIKSIIAHLNSEQFNRIRLGIGRPPRDLMIDYVLGKFSKTEYETLQQGIISKTVTLFTELPDISFKDLMATYNKKEKQTDK